MRRMRLIELYFFATALQNFCMFVIEHIPPSVPAGPAVYLSAPHKQTFTQTRQILTRERGKENKNLGRRFYSESGDPGIIFVAMLVHKFR